MKITKTLFSLAFIHGLKEAFFLILAPFLPEQFEKKGISSIYFTPLFVQFIVCLQLKVLYRGFILYCPINWKVSIKTGKNQEGVVSQLEFASGWGGVLGFIISSFLSYVIGYQGPFIFSIFQSFLIKFIPRTHNSSEQLTARELIAQKLKDLAFNQSMVLNRLKSLSFEQSYNKNELKLEDIEMDDFEIKKKSGENSEKSSSGSSSSEKIDISPYIEDEELDQAFDIKIQAETQKKSEVSYFDIFKSKFGIFAAIDIVICCQIFTFTDTVMPYYLEENFKYSPSIVSLIFACQNFALMITCFLVPKLTKKYNLFLCIIIAQIVQGFGAQLIGPSEFLKIPNHISVMIIGLMINGMATNLSIIPPYKQLELCLLSQQGKNYDHEKVKDAVSGIFNALYDLGSTFGPIFGYFLTEATDFKMAANIHGYILIFVATMQLIIVYIPQKLEEKSSIKNNHKKQS
ncbi:major facilitator superfamily [Stylonychia lemnae]|uniref:Major facilitator superfamily n=1 Tax=Stylonychia lemnae TaxID=5949 RepID=A0A078BA25_STYLE|nr:major facilitator superfamily [Stylonychia lemnae]|eukprot:CDW90373.1 major facilitator superfamily [Stylonychia lemnae]